MQISKDTLIGQLIRIDEGIPPVLMCVRVHCLGCPASQSESLERTCMVHGIDCDTLISQISEILAAKA